MTINHLNVAAFAARRMVSSVASIRALLADGASKETIKRLLDELNQKFSGARQAIKAAEKELRRTRDRAVRIGDIVAPTAHEVAVKMVYALNRELLGIEILALKRVQVWPDAEEVGAEIDLEQTKAASGDRLIALTHPDRYILMVLDAHRGKALPFARIETESVRMEQQDRSSIRRLSDSTIRARVPVLMDRGFVARPPGTKKQGIAITEAGRDALRFAGGNPTETQRKN